MKQAQGDLLLEHQAGKQEVVAAAARLAHVYKGAEPSPRRHPKSITNQREREKEKKKVLLPSTIALY